MTEERDFLGAGVVHYGDAVRTCRRFEREVGTVLCNILEAQIRAGRLAARGDPKPSAEMRTTGPWVCADLSVDLGEEEPGGLEFGLWWDRTETRHDCVIYVGFNGGPLWARRDIRQPEGGRARLLERGSRWSYLIAPPERPEALEQELEAVLSEFLEGLATAQKARATPHPP